MADDKSDNKTPKATAEIKPELKADKSLDGGPKAALPAPKAKSGGKLLIVLVSVVVLAFVIVLAGSEYFAKRGAEDTSTSTSNGPTVGGPFELVNHKGEVVTEKTFLGDYMMVFFGYTYCPDVCPTVLSDIATTLDILGDEKGGKITPVMISVDPARDTPEHLAEYVSFFHPRTVGLTGTEEQIKVAARTYRVYYSINKPQSDDPLDYLVDHTSIVYLMGPDGKLVTHFSHGTTPEVIAERLGKIL